MHLCATLMFLLPTLTIEDQDSAQWGDQLEDSKFSAPAGARLASGIHLLL